VELIVAIIALNNNLFVVVKSSLLGSILSNTLLVLGTAFLAGGVKFKQQKFGQVAGQVNGIVLLFALLTLVTPAIFAASVDKNSISAPDLLNRVLMLSRGAAVINVVIYVLFLVFQMKTHRHLFEDMEEEEEESQLSLPFALSMLAVLTGIISYSADLLVGSLAPVASTWGLGQAFISVILLPIVGNATEHMTAVTVAMRNKMDLALGIVVGSSTQISVLAIPFIVLVAWPWGKPMTLDFQPFETTVLVFSIFMTNLAISKGESNWLSGLVLLGAYVTVALAFLFHPPITDSADMQSL